MSDRPLLNTIAPQIWVFYCQGTQKGHGGPTRPMTGHTNFSPENEIEHLCVFYLPGKMLTCVCLGPPEDCAPGRPPSSRAHSGSSSLWFWYSRGSFPQSSDPSPSCGPPPRSIPLSLLHCANMSEDQPTQASPPWNCCVLEHWCAVQGGLQVNYINS